MRSEREIRSTIDDVGIFQASKTWLDLKGLIEDRIGIIIEELIATSNWETAIRCQAQIGALRDYLMVPDIILEDLRAKAIREERKE